jgi:tellurite methyltransferase
MEEYSLNENIVEALKFISSGDVLDLGGGEGQDSVFLAKRGFNVTLVNFSHSELDIAKRNAERNNVKINTELKDILEYDFSQYYDLIICNNVLQFFPPEQTYQVINKIKEFTNKNGINIIKSFTEKNSHKHPFMFKENELKNIYKDWEILSYKEYISPEISPVHIHSIVEIIARKI